MHGKLYTLLNIKPSEYVVVKRLFLVQLFLGIATAFLFTSTLTLFLHTFNVHYIPKVYLLAALLLLVANWIYSKLEHAYSARKLLQIIILFSAGSILLTWTGITFIKYKWLPFMLSAWNLVVFMLVGYAFWGMAAIIFNVRESKRIFSLVGSGDLPAKLMGYALVPVLIPYIGVTNLLWFSVLAFAVAYYFLLQFKHAAIDSNLKELEHKNRYPNKSEPSFINRLFHNRLILYISLFSLIAFTIYAFIDYTLLVEIKSRFTQSPDLAIFIGIFFAAGRVLAIFFKILFSSRIISNFGLANSLLISPVVLLMVTGVLFLPGETELAILYTFGIMVLCSEILKSVVQEPAFFILFQPLEPHVRLKGHLIAKGYMLPFALTASGIFLTLWENVNILFIGQMLVVLLVLWIVSVFLVKRSYLRTLVESIKKGWFTGSELFLNDDSVRELLLRKMESTNPKEIIMALELLERSGYKEFVALLRNQFESSFTDVRKYALSSLIRLGEKTFLPLIENQLKTDQTDELRPELLKGYYFLVADLSESEKETLLKLNNNDKKAAFAGLLLRKETQSDKFVKLELDRLVNYSSEPDDKHLALDVISASGTIAFTPLLESLLSSSSEIICKKTIETTGKVKAYSLLNQIIRITEERKAYYALQKALTYFGDQVFAAPELEPTALQPATIDAIIVSAGKIKGDYSTNYLLRLLGTGWQRSDVVIEALWLKQAQVIGEDKGLVERWLDTKLSNCRYKIKTSKAIQTTIGLELLSNALQSELKQDVQKVLKGLALCYDRQRIDRVSKLVQLGEAGKVANAIEILEYSVLKRYFKEVDKVLDFVLVDAADRHFSTATIKTSIPDMLAAVIKDDKMRCSNWTKSVACYLIPAFGSPALLHLLTGDTQLPRNTLFQETKDHVLSILT